MPILAAFVVVIIPLLAVYELFTRDETYAVHVARLLAIFLLIWLLALALLIVEYITRQRFFREAEVARERLRMALMSSKAVVWERDLTTGLSTWFGDLRTVFSLPEDTPAQQSVDLGRYIHPDDRDRVLRAVSTAQEEHGYFREEFRIIRANGTVGWISSAGEFHNGKHGDPERMLGMAVDVTPRKAAEEALKSSEERFSKAFRQSPLALTLTSARDHRYLDVNETFEQITGWRRDEVIGHTPLELQLWVNPAERYEFVRLLSEKGSVRNTEVRFRCKNGTQRFGLGAGELIEIEGEPCILSVIADITDRKEAEDALRQSEEQFSKAFRQSPMSLSLSRIKDHQYIDVNETFERMTGWRRDEVIGRPASGIHLWVDPEQRVRMVERARKEGSLRNLEFRFRCKDGGEKVGMASAELMEIAGEPCILFVVADITDRKLASEALILKEHELSEAQRLAHIGNWRWFPGSGEVNWSDELYRIHGCDPQLFQPSASDLSRLFTPESWGKLQAMMRGAMRKRTVQELDLQIIRPDGTCRWVRARGEAVYDSNEEVVCLRGTAQDITEGKQAEQKLQEYERVIEGTAEMITVVDRDYKYVIANQAFLNHYKLAREQVVGRTIWEVLTGDEIELVIKETLDNCFQGRAIQFDIKYISAGRGARDLMMSYLPIDGPDGIERVAFILQDISERRRTDEALRVSEQRLRLAVQAGRMYVYDWNAESDVIVRSPDCVDILGEGASAETTHDAALAHVHKDDLEPYQLCFAAITPDMSPSPFTYRYVRSDGTVVWLENRSRGLFDETGKLLGKVGVVVDVTERKRAEQALRESEERFRLVANTAPVMIWMSGTDKLCNYFNQPWLEFTGRAMEAQLGDGWTAGVHADDLELCLKTYEQAFDARKPFTMQYRLRRHDGEYRWVVDIGVPRFDAGGLFAGYIGSCIDVTERKQAEEALAHVGRRLIQAHEEERTWIARELHDDINQRLALMAIELEQWRQHLPESTIDLAASVQRFRHRLMEISKDVQGLSHRLHSSKLEYLGIVAAANSFCQDLSQQHKVHVAFTHSDIPRHLPSEVSLAIFRVLQEALQNAVKYSRAREYTVELSGTPGEIELQVVDSGVGFDVAGAMNGQGLGLISMRERLQLVGGTLAIDSRPGQGTTIRARVPFLRAETINMIATG